jgi:hypothetical protein
MLKDFSLLAFGLAAVFAGLADPLNASIRSEDKVLGERHENQALVYFIREGHYVGKARTMFVYADQEFLGVLENKSYTFSYLDPGEYMLWLNWAKVNNEIEVVAGEVYYFNVWQSFEPVGEEFGRALIDVVKFYVSPEDKEIRTSEKHIQNRYQKAEKYATKRTTKDYAGTKSKREEHIAGWPKVDLGAYSVLILEDFKMTDPKASKRKKAYRVEAAPRQIPDEIAETLGEGVFDKIIRNAPREAAKGVVILSGEITQYKPGSETSRMMLAGTGSSHLDFSAILIDADSGDELSRFSGMRTWAWGGGYGANRGIADLEQNVAYEIALYLKRCKMGDEAELEDAPGEIQERPR